jgi:hypothetical protein
MTYTEPSPSFSPLSFGGTWLDVVPIVVIRNPWSFPRNFRKLKKMLDKPKKGVILIASLVC